MSHNIDIILVGQAYDALRMGNVHGALTYLQRFFDDQPTQTDQGRVDQAWRVLKAEYIQELEDAVDSIRTDYCSGSYAANQDKLHQDIDEHAARYTDNDVDAQKCLLFSENTGASYIEHGEALGDWIHGIPWNVLAYSAFRADLREELEEAGIDLNLTPPDTDEIAVHCDSCGEIRIVTPGEETCIECYEGAGNEQCEKCKTWRATEDLENGCCENCATNTD